MAKLNKKLLSTIVSATLSGGFFYVSQADAKPLIEDGLIEVNTGMLNEKGEAAARSTEKGTAMVSGNTAPASQDVTSSTSSFGLISGAELPKATRSGGGGGQKAKYPFEAMAIGNSFFVADTEVESGNALKTLNATVANWNEKFKEETGETKTVTRAVRGEGRKAVIGEDGKPVMETVTLPVKRALRKFTARAVTGGKAYGTWTAPADGALVARIA